MHTNTQATTEGNTSTHDSTSHGGKIRGAAQVVHGLGENIRGTALGAVDTILHDKKGEARNDDIARKGRMEISEGLSKVRGSKSGPPDTVGSSGLGANGHTAAAPPALPPRPLETEHTGLTKNNTKGPQTAYEQPQPDTYDGQGINAPQGKDPIYSSSTGTGDEVKRAAPPGVSNTTETRPGVGQPVAGNGYGESKSYASDQKLGGDHSVGVGAGRREFDPSGDTGQTRGPVHYATEADNDGFSRHEHTRDNDPIRDETVHGSAARTSSITTETRPGAGQAVAGNGHEFKPYASDQKYGGDHSVVGDSRREFDSSGDAGKLDQIHGDDHPAHYAAEDDHGRFDQHVYTRDNAKRDETGHGPAARSISNTTETLSGTGQAVAGNGHGEFKPYASDQKYGGDHSVFGDGRREFDPSGDVSKLDQTLGDYAAEDDPAAAPTSYNATETRPAVAGNGYSEFNSYAGDQKRGGDHSVGVGDGRREFDPNRDAGKLDQTHGDDHPAQYSAEDDHGEFNRHEPTRDNDPIRDETGYGSTARTSANTTETRPGAGQTVAGNGYGELKPYTSDQKHGGDHSVGVADGRKEFDPSRDAGKLDQTHGDDHPVPYPAEDDHGEFNRHKRTRGDDPMRRDETEHGLDARTSEHDQAPQDSLGRYEGTNVRRGDNVGAEDNALGPGV